MSDTFTPATAVITGGASGIGLAVARKLAAQGTRVMLADLPGEKLEAAAARVDGAIALGCDVRERDEIEALADAAFDRLGSVELLLNNAGVGGAGGKRLWECDEDAARALFEVNFWAVWRGCAIFAPRMAAQDRQSAIYNTGSENSWFCAMPRMHAYVAAKHAVLGLTENLREDLPEHVHAGLIIPGWVATDIGDPQFMRHGMDADHYAEIVVPQILARRRFVVSHYSNLARIGERVTALRDSYEHFAERDAMDVREFVARLMQRRERGGD